MPTLMSWTTIEIGDLDIFAPTLPSLVVYTWYVDDEPESTVTHFWRDEDSGMTLHELVLVAPVAFEEAVTRAQQEAPKRSVERIHVKHARSAKTPSPKKPEGATTPKKAAPKQAAKTSAAPPKKSAPVKTKAAKPEGGKPKQAS